MNAPVVLVVYNRPEHTAKTLAALSKNNLAAQSNLYVYSDAAVTQADFTNVEAVRAIVRAATGFNKIEMIERSVNHGLANNIIGAVSEVCDAHGRIILLEDDLVTSQDFLQFMNRALDRYQDDPRVWHISGWTYPLESTGLDHAFFWPIMNCWGWATWADRWGHYRKDPAALLQHWPLPRRRAFNLDNAHPFFSQVIGNYLGTNDTWAVFWYATIFEHQGLCLTPTQSLVLNIGTDGTGTHRATMGHNFQQELRAAAIDWASSPLPDAIQDNALALERVRDHLKRNTALSQKLINAIKTFTPTMVYRAMRPWHS